MVDFLKRFHTGTANLEITESRNQPEYMAWHNIRDVVKILRDQHRCILNDDGTLTPVGAAYTAECWYCEGIDIVGFYTCIDAMLNAGCFPVEELEISNFATMTEDGVRLFLSDLSAHLGSNVMLFNPTWEFNMGTPPKVAAEDYNRQMKMMVRVRDELGITNILLGSHANMILAEEGWEQWYDPWLPGIRCADILGFSGYHDDVNKIWWEAEQFYNRIGQPEKPFIMFEYANNCYVTNEPITGDFIRATYAKVPDYPFVKAVIWGFGRFFDEFVHPAIGTEAARWDGYTPTPRILATVGGIVVGGGIGYALKPENPVVPILVGAVAGGTVGYIIDRLRS